MQEIHELAIRLIMMGDRIPALIGYILINISLFFYHYQKSELIMNKSGDGAAWGATSAGGGFVGFASPDFILQLIGVIVGVVGVVMAIRSFRHNKKALEFEKKKHADEMAMRREELKFGMLNASKNKQE